MKTHFGKDWSRIARFNFTYAIPGGTWLEWHPVQTSDGMKADREWFSFATIGPILGTEWIDRQLRKQGWMTGCWIDVS